MPYMMHLGRTNTSTFKDDELSFMKLKMVFMEFLDLCSFISVAHLSLGVPSTPISFNELNYHKYLLCLNQFNYPEP
jgi:hypothetical protein